jgi:hypothetical protein
MVPRLFSVLGILIPAAFWTVSTLPSPAQPSASLFRFTADLKSRAPNNPEQYYCSNSLHVILTWNRPAWIGTNAVPKLELRHLDETSPAAIIEKAGAERAEAALASPRVFTADSLLYMNRDPAFLRNPVDLATDRGIADFRGTAVQSLGDYLDANYHPGGLMGFLRETFLDNPYDKRIISPLSPITAGDPGTAYAKEGGIHFGLRDVLSSDPKSFITFSDKAELDATAHNPSFILRNPIYIDDKAFITTLAVEYPDWKVSGWSVPKIGATIAYVHGKHGIYLTASAGRDNLVSSQGDIQSVYERKIMLYTNYAF